MDEFHAAWRYININYNTIVSQLGSEKDKTIIDYFAAVENRRSVNTDIRLTDMALF